jgi:hypothetical protein
MVATETGHGKHNSCNNNTTCESFEAELHAKLRNNFIDGWIMDALIDNI